MPHLVIEYTPNLEENVDFKKLLVALFEKYATLNTPAPQKALKIRAVKLENAYIGEAGFDGKLAHFTLGTVSNTPEELNRQLDALFPVVKEAIQPHHPDCLFSAEARELNPATYRKF